MAIRYVSGDPTRIPHTPSGADIPAQSFVVTGDVLRIAHLEIKDGEKGTLYEGGIYVGPKATGGGSAIADGKKVYYDVGDDELKEDAEAGANKLAGVTVAAAGDNDDTVRFRHAPELA